VGQARKLKGKVADHMPTEIKKGDRRIVVPVLVFKKT
jgi:hypothetical protein